MRRTKNLLDDIDQETGEIRSFGELTRFNRFLFRIIIPMQCRIIAAQTGFDDAPMQVTAREIRDEYGLAASQVFVHLFKLLKRGGFSKRSRTGFKSKWVSNRNAMLRFAEWSEDLTQERTCRSLLHYLEAHGVQRLEHAGPLEGWMEHSARSALMLNRRESWRLARAAVLRRTVEELEQYNATYY